MFDWERRLGDVCVNDDDDESAAVESGASLASIASGGGRTFTQQRLSEGEGG